MVRIVDRFQCLKECAELGVVAAGCRGGSEFAIQGQPFFTLFRFAAWLNGGGQQVGENATGIE